MIFLVLYIKQILLRHTKAQKVMVPSLLITNFTGAVFAKNVDEMDFQVFSYKKWTLIISDSQGSNVNRTQTRTRT